MRGDIVYRVYGVHEGREQDVHLGTFSTRADAEAEIEKCKARDDGSWATKHHDKGLVVRTATVETDFEIPPQPKPRDKYGVEVTETSPPGAWTTIRVDVLRRDLGSGRIEKICSYDRRYSMLYTFEPLRQGDREFALVSQNYTSTDVLDLRTGNVIAMEPESSGGFCLVGFYVPDWWDLHTGTVIPGSESWNADLEWPTGQFGFVWGCHWGDDSSWKVQYLDLSRIQEGVITATIGLGTWSSRLALTSRHGSISEPRVLAASDRPAPGRRRSFEREAAEEQLDIAEAHRISILQ